MNAYTYYLDLRCPFCFAQTRRLVACTAPYALEPRTVRHDRELPVPALPPTDAVRASLEGYRARLAAEGVAIELPSLWPNTRAASALIAAAVVREPAAAFALAAKLFDALWVEHEDISHALVLERAARAVGVARLRAQPSDASTLAAWQRTWDEHQPAWKTPVLVSPTGAMLQGLASPRRIEAFLRAGKLSDSSESACDTGELASSL